MRKISRMVPVALLPLALAGCFSTGSGGSSPNSPDVVGPIGEYQRFTSFAEMKRGATTKLEGLGVEAGHEAGGEPVFEEMRLAPGQTARGTAEVDVRLDNDGRIEGVTVYGPDSMRTWSVDDRGEAMAGGHNVGFYGDDGNLTVQAADAGFDYQTFGVWSTGRNRADDPASSGAFSVGAATKYPDVPVRGSANFRGSSLGTFVDRDGGEFLVSQDVSLEADFEDRIVYYSGTDAAITDLSDGSPSLHDASLFDMSGSMSYGAANAMSGDVVAKNGMTGTLQGQFYGAGAQEIGGTILMRGEDSAGSEIFTGSFGAKR